MNLVIPDEVGLRVRVAGVEGERWLNSLPERIEYLRSKWRFTQGEVLTGGSESLVVSVACDSGEPAVIKLGLPGVCDCAYEAKVLRLAADAPYVTLIDHDMEANALLLERLGDKLADTGLSIDAQIGVLCETMRQGWISLLPDTGLMTGAEKARWLADFIDSTWREVGPGISGAVRERAIAFAGERAEAFTEIGSVLVHGDGHQNNTLSALPPHTGYRLVDPDGLFAEPACDLAVPMRGWSEPLLRGDALELGRRRCKQIAALTDVDETAIWQWGTMERVSTGLLLLQIGMEKEGRETLAVAEAWCKDYER